MKLASCKSALNPPVVCFTDRSKAVVPVLVLLLVALWFILRGDLLCFFPCHFVLVFFGPFSVAVASLGEEGANLSAFRTLILVLFVRLYGLCLFRFVGFPFLCVCVCGGGGGGGAAVCDCGTPWTFLLLFSNVSTGRLEKWS